MDKKQKQEKIVEMFDDIASTYDLANRVLSFGIDVVWRKKGCNIAFDLLNKKQIEQVTDVATGTGDLLIHWKNEANKRGIEIEKFVGVDPSVGMLEVAKKKVDFATFVEGKAQELPLENESSEIISISYGIRNVVDRKEALEEFLTTKMLVDELEQAGFEHKYSKSFSMGISTLIVAQKPNA